MNIKTKIIIAVLITVFIAGYGGYWWGSRSITRPGLNQNGFSGRNSQGMANRRVNSGFATGDILAKDDKGLTIKLRNGGSQIILVAPSTEVSKMSQTDQSELQIGKSIVVTGKTNSDGSVTASSIQIRPNTPAPMGGGQGSN